MVKENKCSYGMVSRQMIVDTKQDIGEIKKTLSDIEIKITELFNHQSNRLPMNITILISILSSLVVGLAVYCLTGG